ncbi:MAG: BMP family ABC transporter substrate-binding protein [Actinomycetota bacterium]
MIKSKKLLALGLAAGLVLAACGDDDESSSDTTAEASDSTETTDEMSEDTTASTAAGGGDTAAGDSDCTVGMAFDITGRGDRSFNDAAGAALDQAVADLGITFVESTPTGDGDRTQRLQGLIDEGAGLVQGNGFLFTDSIGEVAPANPDTTFTLVDSVVEEPNVVNLLFAEEQGSFLVGAAAALKSQTGTIGFIGGVENDLIKKFEAGYAAGAEAVNPDIEVLVNYITQPPDFDGFNDPARGREIAAAQYEEGADVIYSAAGSSGLGAFEAAVEAGEPGEVWAIGVDSDQYELVEPDLQPYILTSMLKRVDVATFLAIEQFCAGEIEAGVQVFDLSVDGVGYSTTGGFVDDIAEELDAFKEQIINGEIEVPTTP